MNFYTFFKSESKKDCKFYNLEYPEFPVSLSSFRNTMLRSSFSLSCLDVHHFQVACFRVLPIDLPKSFYENLYDRLFRSFSRNFVLIDEQNKITDYALKLTAELVSILEAEHV